MHDPERLAHASMSHYHVSPPARGRIAGGAIGLLVAAALASAMMAGWSASRPVSVTIDGRPVRLAAGATVGDVERQELLAATPGDLIGVSGSVVETGGGQPIRVERNGRHAGPWQRLYEGDVVVSAQGSDMTESLVVTQTLMPFGSRFEGKGPIVELKRLGAPGIKRATVGERSGIEITSTVIAEPRDTVFTRMRPRPGDKLVALTFDDGPRRGQTDRVLDILAEQRVPATFFVVGSEAKAEPELVRRMVAEGHLVGNHSYAHRKMTSLDRKNIRREVVNGRKAIARVGGGRTGWFRPPYGAVDREVWHELEHLDQRVVMWDVDPRDWSRPGTKQIVKRVVSATRPGAIVLLHDGGDNRRQTVAALPAIIERLKAKGYVFVTVEDLAAAK